MRDTIIKREKRVRFVRDAERWTKTRSDEPNTKFGTAVGGSPSPGAWIYRVYIVALLMHSSFSFFFFSQFPIIALCPHHMSFTSNYRKLRVSPNARELKYAPRVLPLSLFHFQIRRGAAKGAEETKR